MVPNQVLYQAELLPEYGAPSRSRIHNLLIRSQTLYPVELWAHFIKFVLKRNGAEDRNRTGTVVTYRRILSPVRLPVPPPRHIWSGRRGSNPRPPPWQGDVLPLNYFRICMCYLIWQLLSFIINGAGEGSRTPTPCGARS